MSSNDNPWPASMRNATQRSMIALGSGDEQLRDGGDELADLLAVLARRYERIEAIDPDDKSTYRAYGKGGRTEFKVRRLPPSRQELVARLKQIRGPYVVPMGESELLDDGSSLLVMEQIPGSDLQERMAVGAGAVSEEMSLNWMKQVCEGMTYVAAQNVVHRNLKPANIVIDKAGTAHVANFVLASMAGAKEAPAGTPAYMAPEIWDASTAVDVRNDIYSFGATFFHALTGTMPWGNGDRVPEATLPFAKAIAPHLSESTARLLERCLATLPEERFQSFVELLTQLDRPAKPIRLQGFAPRLPGYHLLSCLGEGGMGVVYKARRTDSNRLVAIKFIHRFGRNNVDLLIRFRIEAEAVACLRHPNIVAVLDVGAFGGYPYLALEYVEGASIHDRLAEFTSDPRRCAEVAASVARGLHHSHRLGILHRDLKPQNVLLARDGAPKIADFGLAKFTVTGKGRDRLWQESILPGIRGSLLALDRMMPEDGWEQRLVEDTKDALAACGTECYETLTMELVQQFVTNAVRQAETHDARFLQDSPTRDGDILGTPAYMAPEQTSGDSDAIGPSTDVYALGVMLYQMLSGQLPFHSTSLSKLFDKIRHTPPAPLGRSVPASLAQICMRCLSKRPEHRYRSAAELADELERFLSSPPPKRRIWWRAWQ